MEPSQTCRSSPPISSTQEKNVHPRTVVLEKDDSCGFGFTLRHFIVYPPTALKSDSVKGDIKQSSTDSLQWRTDDQNSPMDTIFIREVSKGSPADETGLHKGDRIIAINNQPVTGKTYSDIVNLIRRSGNSIKLLVVPKEDDILQLYFASSAYQPVYRGHKQHKYFVPSYHDSKHQNKTNKPFENISLSDERTTRLHSPVGECDCQNGHNKIECRFSEARLLHEQKKKHELFYAQEVSFLSPLETHKKYLVKKDSGFPVPVPLSPSRINDFEEESCQDQYFSNTADTKETLEVVSSPEVVNLVHALPCRTIDTQNSIEDQSSNIWDNKSLSVGSFISHTEANNHYMSSDFGTMAHCDKSESGSSCVAALISNTMKGLMPHLSSFHAEQYFGRDVSESSMNLSGDSMDSFCSLSISETCDPSSGAPKSNISQNMSDLYNSSLSDSECFKSTQGYSTNSVNVRTKGNIKKHLVTNGLTDDNADNCNNSSINLVAQRCHLFESGSMLAQSLERMSMYRSELSRMSKPNHIVSARTAHFEHLSPSSCVPSSVTSSALIKSLDEEISGVMEDQMPCEEKNVVQKKENMAEETTNRYSDALAGYVSADQGSAENLNHEDTQETNVSLPKTVESSSLSSGIVLSSSEENNAHHSPVISGVVYRRKTVPTSEQDECHVARRISYLRATAEDRMSDDLEISGEDDDDSSEVISPSKDHRIQKLKAFFGEKTPRLKHALQPVPAPEEEDIPTESSELSKSIYGWLICKVVALEGKRSSDRSWRHVWAILRNNTLYLLKERREPSTRSLTCDDHVINVRNSITNVASDYQKRKHVLRLTLLNGTEYLVQAENHASMMEWLQALQVFAAEVTKFPGVLNSISVLEKAAAYEQQIQSKGRAPLQQAQHPVRKLVFRHRSPSDSSTTVKTRRASQGDELVLSKIGIIWRDRMVQGWKKVHGGSSQNSSKCASFGARLEDAPSAVTNEHVPLLVELCAQIVETRGLDMIGIYRVPGNNAAVSLLTETVNQGLEDIDLSDTRWNDVNIVSSLLKAYFRKLPEPLLTSNLYAKFILASKIDDPIKRLVAIKKLLQELPIHHYETLRFLMHHLKKVVEHSDVNKMEARNLAIVFGPTLARSRDNNMITMVTDMSHQCYLVETLITYVNWLFEDRSDTVPFEMNVKDKRKTHPPPTIHSSALLSNIDKLDRSRGDGLQDILPQEIFTSLRNTTRHLRNRNRKKTGEWESEMAFKRSGIIEQDELTCDLLDNLDLHDTVASKTGVRNRLMPSPQSNSSHVTNKDDCSSLASEYGKQHSSCEERTSGIDSMCSMQQVVTSDDGPISDHDICDHSSHTETDEIVLHTYDELSALAQEKIRNFERETKALLKRGVTKPKTSSKPGHVEWEKIEREWQKAKQELEQEDLLDHLADDPSFLSLLLCRGDESYQSDTGTIQDKNSSLSSCMSSDSSYVINPRTKASSEVASNHNQQKNINQASSVSAYQKSLSVSLTKEQFMHPCVTEDKCISDHSEESVHQKELTSVVSGGGSSVTRATSITSIPVHQDKQFETPLSTAKTSCVKPSRTTLTITTTLPLADTVVTSVSCSAKINMTTGPTNYLHLPTYSRSETFGVDSCVTTSSSNNTQVNTSDAHVENCQKELSVTDDSTHDCKADNQHVPPKS